MSSKTFSKDAEEFVERILDFPNWKEIHSIFKAGPTERHSTTNGYRYWYDNMNKEDQATFKPVMDMVLEKYRPGNCPILLQKIRTELCRIVV